ncbi:F-box protein CPR1-like [Euphorbia lathyris]|uniref:F-box protein CPR1-like n=1 Tax=Euphorbia lathyris TaxID=212925 RepID=UPI003313C7F4
MANLPQDLRNQILIRLPVKSLLRFRCVCKSWRAIIDSRDFIYSHLHTSSKNRLHRKLILSSRSNLRRLSTVFRAIDINDGFQEEFLLNFQNSRINLGLAVYCNGLVIFNTWDDKFTILNPSTRHYRTLPTFHQFYRGIKALGFGYDATADDYKLLVLLYSDPSFEVWILGLKSNCWRRLPVFPYTEYNFIEVACDGNSFVDGCVHFLCSRNREGSYAIVAFDVSEETFSVVALPISQNQAYPTCLQVFEGCLSIRFFTERKVDLYVRKKEGVEFIWTKLFALTTLQTYMLEIGTQFNKEFRTLGYSKEDDKILLIFSGNMYSYDVKETSLEVIRSSSLSDLYNCGYCVESLVSIGS